MAALSAAELTTLLQQLQMQQQQLLDQQTVNMKSILEEVMLNKSEGKKVDVRALGGPPEWDSSKEDQFQEWNIKIKAWLVSQNANALDWLKTVTTMADKMETSDLDLQQFPSDKDRAECKSFNTLLYNILITKLRGEAFNIVSSVRDGCGLEAWRLLMKRYEPRTPATKRALLKGIFNMKAAKKVEDMEKNLLKLEDLFSRYETMATTKLPEDIKTVIMIEHDGT